MNAYESVAKLNALKSILFVRFKVQFYVDFLEKIESDHDWYNKSKYQFF